MCVLTKICDKLSAETLTLERYTRSYNFRLFNVPEVAGESAKDVMEKVNTLIHQVTGVDLKVEFGHRTGSKRDDDSPRPVICRIASRSQKMEMMAKRGEFFTKGFPIYDDLPAVDLLEKKKHAAVIKVKYEQKHKTQFIRGKWYLNGEVYNG